MDKNEHHYAVVVGINKYPGISDLKYAVNDSEEFTKWLLDPKGGNLPKKNVHLLSIPDRDQDDPLERVDAKPIKLLVDEAILTVIQKAEAAFKSKPDNWYSCRFYFFGSGHGFTPAANEAALLMANSGPDMYGENVGTTALANLLAERQPFSEVLIFADCCRQRVNSAKVGAFPYDKVTKENGIVKVFGASATRFGALAFESGDPKIGLSYFTQAVLEGLKGEGLKQDETEVTSTGLEDFINSRLRFLTKDKKSTQVPDINHNRADPFLVTTVDPDSLKQDRFHLKFPSGLTDSVRLLDGEFNPLTEHGEHDPTTGDWPLNLKFGLYKIVRASDGEDLPLKNFGMFQVTSGEGEHVFIHAI